MILGLGRHTTPGKKSLSKNFNIQAHKNPSLFRHRLEHSLGEKTGKTERSNFWRWSFYSMVLIDISKSWNFEIIILYQE